MNQVETLSQERVFSFSDLRDSKVVKEQEKPKNRANDWSTYVCFTHFKTLDEIEQDFRLEKTRDLLAQQEYRNNRDGYLNINLERIDSGFMEENY